jgi:hypothetical protein
MWISKKKFNQMMAEAVEKERDKEMLYRFMDEMHCRMNKLEDMNIQLEEEVAKLQHIVHSRPVGKKQLNG